ncbi:MAG: hypothetical protein H5U40_07230 [Polyangiaceae bacterium]|nr:hypothetical protein [Polyangiaceae bacterium]
MSALDLAARLRAICAAVGFDLDRVNVRVLDRMTLLAARTQTVADLERMAAAALEVFRYYESAKPSEAFTEAERRIIVLGCLFSDIGKTGPARASSDEQQLIVDMFSIESVPDETQPVTRFLRTYFPEDAEERIARFESLGLDPEMPIRQFWNLHSAWTLELVEASGVPPEAVAAAASHHLLDDVNPETIVGADRRYTRWFGENMGFDRSEKLVVILDKYDALRRRGHLTHPQAIAWLRERIKKNPLFRGDSELETLIEDLDAVARSGVFGSLD